MAGVLITLAIGSALAGYIGIPHALGGHNGLGTWLEPAFAANNCGAPVTTGALAGIAIENCAPGTDPALASMKSTASVAEPVVQPGLDLPEGRSEAASPVEDETSLELTLMVVSSLIALLGIGLARYLWLQNPGLPQRMATQYAGLHRLLLNKYYVDEAYDAAVVQPIKAASTEGLWRGLDVKVVDGAVNLTAQIVGIMAAVLRLLQTGSVKSYATGTFLGGVAILAYYLWR
jgi:NADH-quinone oxidoreductase subunit L